MASYTAQMLSRTNCTNRGFFPLDWKKRKQKEQLKHDNYACIKNRVKFDHKKDAIKENHGATLMLQKSVNCTLPHSSSHTY